MQRVGLPILAIVSIIEVTHTMPQKVRTKVVYSETTFGGSQITKGFKSNMQVLLQVNGSAPQIWSIFRSVIFAALREQGFGIHSSN